MTRRGWARGHALRKPRHIICLLPVRVWQAPEIINGRLAMLGFVAAVIGEVRTHQTIVEQFQSAPAFVFSVVLAFSVATLIPIVHGTDYRPAGLLTPGAEIWNGRVAMIGLAGMILVEQRFGTSIFG